jgi:DNA-binding response OmpR family regulator
MPPLPALLAPESLSPAVLVIEDDPVEQHLLAAVAEKAGFRVRLASTVAEAESIADRLPIDLIIADLGLPDGDGLALVERLQSRPYLKDVGFLVCSGQATLERVQEAVRLGALQYVKKPIDADDLESRLVAARAHVPLRFESNDVMQARLLRRGTLKYADLLKLTQRHIGVLRSRLAELERAEAASAAGERDAAGEPARPPGKPSITLAHLVNQVVSTVSRAGAVRFATLLQEQWTDVEAGGSSQLLGFLLTIELAAHTDYLASLAVVGGRR